MIMCRFRIPSLSSCQKSSKLAGFVEHEVTSFLPIYLCLGNPTLKDPFLDSWGFLIPLFQLLLPVQKQKYFRAPVVSHQQGVSNSQNLTSSFSL